MNLGEVSYILMRKPGVDAAERAEAIIFWSGIGAGAIGALVTGDREFEALERRGVIRVEWFR